jgi:NAD(P)-dependent dehydrogenase (short-subunit alcohol dehydrogenase family)
LANDTSQVSLARSTAESINRLWLNLKCWRKVSIGPVSFFYRFGRNVPVLNNRSRRRLRQQPGIAPQLSSQVLPSAVPHALLEQSLLLETALIVGVGPGYGFELARRFAAAGMRVAIASRNANRLEDLVVELRAAGHDVAAFGCDATDEQSVAALLDEVTSALGAPHLVVFAVQAFCPGKVMETEVAAFEESWRQNCLAGFIVARAAARAMVPLGRGSIVLTGSTSSLIGRESHLNLAVGKFGLRALSQVLAREVWPLGVHVAHVVIDADVSEADKFEPSFPQADPQHLADAIYNLHRQPKSAWTSEMDFRPWDEKFWEHC